MPRIARVVFPGVAYHVVQRGNHRQDVFYDNGDKFQFAEWLGFYSRKHEVEILAYCLMDNHVHYVLVPGTRDALEKMLRPLHMRHSQHINRKREWKGHLWQGRFFSSPMDDAYTLTAIGYVELNPVRAGLVSEAQQYQWSSAAGHCGLRHDVLLTHSKEWQRKISAVGDWRTWLKRGQDQDELDYLRRNLGRGLPCGSDEFIRIAETMTERCLTGPGRGRPKKGLRPHF